MISSTDLGYVIFGSGIAAACFTVLLTWIKDALTEKSRLARERKANLYSQLEFYLRLSKINRGVRDGLTQDYINNSQKKRSSHATNSLEGTEDFRNAISLPIKDWWAYINKIKELLETNPHYLEKKHWPLVEKFFKAYFEREILFGKDVYKDTTYLFGDKKIEQGADGLLAVVDELYRCIVEM